MKIAFYKARGTLLDRTIRVWMAGPYSHVEAVLADNGDGTFECASSVPGIGVRIANIELPTSDWDIIEVEADEGAARAWFTDLVGRKYDWIGIFGFVFRPARPERRRYFCSEAVGTAIGFNEAWRFDPNALADAIERNRRYQAMFAVGEADAD